MITRIGLFFLLLITTGVSPNNWILMGSTCFQADKLKVNQQRATEICLLRGGVLHSVKNYEELVAFKSLLDLPYNYWVSAKKTRNGFKWSDGRSCCPTSWWVPTEPGSGDTCARLNGNSMVKLLGHSCTQLFGFLCSKPAVWTLVKSTDYYFDELCGVEIMPNCQGLSCENVCQSHHDCDQFAKIYNMCVNIKNVSQTDDCVVKLRSNMELFKNSC